MFRGTARRCFVCLVPTRATLTHTGMFPSVTFHNRTAAGLPRTRHRRDFQWLRGYARGRTFNFIRPICPYASCPAIFHLVASLLSDLTRARLHSRFAFKFIFVFATSLPFHSFHLLVSINSQPLCMRYFFSFCLKIFSCTLSGVIRPAPNRSMHTCDSFAPTGHHHGG